VKGEIITSILDDLKYKSLVGEGYFSIVKKYRSISTGEHIAAKELKRQFYDDGDYRYRFSREIQLLKDLKGHKNIINLLGSENDRDDKKYFYLMPYYSENLFDYIKRNNTTLQIEQRLLIFDQILSALEFSHSKNIIHRDISPTNILLDNNDSLEVKVSDFGLGKNEESLSHYTHSSVSNYGQILYVSPEQKDKLKNATVRSDIFSLGKLLYFVLTGRDPLSFDSTQFSTVINKAIHDNPDQRHQDIAEFILNYESVKKFIFTKEIPSEYLVLKDYINQEGAINWLQFHEIVKKGGINDHVYYDYIDPVIRALRKGNNLRDYYTEVGSSILEFVSKFIDNIRECFSSTGWPFSELDTFGDFLFDIFRLVKEDNVKLLCLEGIWEIAYGADQWHVQSIVEEIFKKELIKDDLEIQFAQIIKELNIKVELSRINSSSIPQKIKLALIDLLEK